MSILPADTLRARLRDRFAGRVLALEPGSVLDVGCGSGELIGALQAAGLRAAGIEAGPEAAAAARARGLPVARADAARLPLPDGSVGWVTLRHVPHHLERPREAAAEAWRVARRGVVLADPFYDGSRPDQERGLRADRWLKRMDRRRGRFHADVLSPAALAALLPEKGAHVRTEFLTSPGPWTRNDLELERARSTEGVRVLPEEEAEWRDLLEAATAGGVSLSGTAVVIAWKRAPATDRSGSA